MKTGAWQPDGRATGPGSSTPEVDDRKLVERYMFVAQAVLIDIRFEVARPQLVHPVTNGEFDGAVAYRDGLTALMRVGPLGDVVSV